MSRRAALALAPLLAAAALAALAPPAGAAAGAAAKAEQRAIEREVMCPVCGTLLELAEAPQARRQKAFIARLIAQGKSREEVKRALVAEYGEEVLALPRGSGFSLSAYLVPIALLLVAAAALAGGLLRWRRDGGGPPAAAPAPDDAERARLDADLSRYDL